MSKFERKIDRARGMGQCPDGDEVNTRGGDLAHVPQVHSSAGFKFYLAFSDRDRFAHLRPAHVIQEDHFHSRHLAERAHLIEVIRLDFDSYSWPFLSHALDCAVQLRESVAREEVIILYQDHIEETKPMIGPTPRPDCRLFEFAQARGGLARVEKFGPLRSGRFNKLVRQTRNPT